MSQCLPTHGFRWLSQDEIDALNISQVSDDGTDGFILEVDLKYPAHLHDQHNQYPLAPEKINISQEMLSPYAQETLKKTQPDGRDGFRYTTSEKLVPNLHDKVKYVVHYRNLKLYQSLGMEVTKVHWVMTFKQSAWMKSYIDFNTQKRKEAKNAFEKDFFKLMNNR